DRGFRGIGAWSAVRRSCDRHPLAAPARLTALRVIRFRGRFNLAPGRDRHHEDRSAWVSRRAARAAVWRGNSRSGYAPLSGTTQSEPRSGMGTGSDCPRGRHVLGKRGLTRYLYTKVVSCPSSQAMLQQTTNAPPAASEPPTSIALATGQTIDLSFIPEGSGTL